MILGHHFHAVWVALCQKPLPLGRTMFDKAKRTLMPGSEGSFLIDAANRKFLWQFPRCRPIPGLCTLNYMSLERSQAKRFGLEGANQWNVSLASPSFRLLRYSNCCGRTCFCFKKPVCWREHTKLRVAPNFSKMTTACESRIFIAKFGFTTHETESQHPILSSGQKLR